MGYIRYPLLGGSSITATSPLVLSGGILSLPQATSTQNGFLSSSDWATFNSKLSSFTETDPLSIHLNGSTTPSANIPWGGFGITGITSLASAGDMLLNVVNGSTSGTITLQAQSLVIGDPTNNYANNFIHLIAPQAQDSCRILMGGTVASPAVALISSGGTFSIYDSASAGYYLNFDNLGNIQDDQRAWVKSADANMSRISYGWCPFGYGPIWGRYWGLHALNQVTVGVPTTHNNSLGASLAIQGQGLQSLDVTTTANASTTISTTVGTQALFENVGIGDYIQVSGLSTYGRVTGIVDNNTVTVDTALGDGTSRGINVLRPIASLRTSAGTEIVGLDNAGTLTLPALAAPASLIGDLVINSSSVVSSVTRAYGHMYGDNISQAVVISTIDTYVQVPAGLSGGITSGFTFQNARELKCTVAGTYAVQWTMSLDQSSGSNVEFEGTIMVNAVADHTATAHGTSSSAAHPDTIGGSTIVALAVNDLVSLGVSNHTNTNDCIVEHATATIIRIA